MEGIQGVGISEMGSKNARGDHSNSSIAQNVAATVWNPN